MGRRRRRTPVIYTSACHPRARRPSSLERRWDISNRAAGRDARWSHPPLLVARSRSGLVSPMGVRSRSRQLASEQDRPTMGVCFVPRFLPEVVPVSSLSTSRHLLASLGMMRGGPRPAGETGQGGGELYGCNDTPPPCRASGEHLVDLRTCILTWRGPGRGSDPRCLGPFSLGRASWSVCSLLFRT